MHFAGPPRKSSHPPPYALKPKRTVFWRRHSLNARFIAVVVLGALSILLLLFRLLGGLSSAADTFTKAPRGEPNVVLVTTIDPNLGKDLVAALKHNRDAYANQHGTTGSER